MNPSSASNDSATTRTANSTTVWLAAMGGTLAFIVGLGIYLAEVIGRDSPLSVALACVGISAFLFLLKIKSVDSRSNRLTEATMRFAIAGAIVIEYLVLVAVVAFFRETPEDLHPLTKTLIGNFTTIVGIVIAFYFGSSAYAQSNRKR